MTNFYTIQNFTRSGKISFDAMEVGKQSALNTDLCCIDGIGIGVQNQNHQKRRNQMTQKFDTSPPVVIIEVEASFPIRSEIVTGMQKIVKNLTSDDGGTFNKEESKIFVEFLNRVGKGSSFDFIHMRKLTRKETLALFGDIYDTQE